MHKDYSRIIASEWRRVVRALLLLLLAAATCPLRARAQAQTVEAILDQSYHAMYNLQFDDALRTAEEAKALDKDKDDPLPWTAQACAVLFREFDRLHILTSELFASDETFSARKAHSWNASAKRDFDDILANVEKLAQHRLDRDKNDTKALFALAIASGLRADDAALIGKKNLAALGYTKAATNYAERLLALAPDSYDAYVATGVGKYLIGGKPAPVRWILRLGGLKGDQEEGLKELSLAAEHGRYLAPFARILLAFDDLRHKNKSAARIKLASLSQQFPNNTLLHLEMAKLDRPSTTGQ